MDLDLEGLLNRLEEWGKEFKDEYNSLEQDLKLEICFRIPYDYSQEFIPLKFKYFHRISGWGRRKYNYKLLYNVNTDKISFDRYLEYPRDYLNMIYGCLCMNRQLMEDSILIRFRDLQLKNWNKVIGILKGYFPSSITSQNTTAHKKSKEFYIKNLNWGCVYKYYEFHLNIEDLYLLSLTPKIIYTKIDLDLCGYYLK